MAGTGRKDQLLDSLPSKLEYYNKFDRDPRYCMYFTNADFEDDIKRKLQTYPGIQGDIKKITEALCYVSHMKEKKKADGDLCHFFDFWLRNILLKKVPASSSEIISTIYDEWKNLDKENWCNSTHEEVPEDLFNQRKEVLAYYKDYDTIQRDFRDYGSTCGSAYDKHLKAIKTACTTVIADCQQRKTDHPSDPYCAWFNTKSKDYCDSSKLSELTCKPKPNPNPNQAGSSGSFSDADLADGVSGGEGKGGSDGGGSHRKEGEEADGSAVIPGAVSGGLAAIGLPAMAYFFYKYKSHLFFLKGNNHSAAGMSGRRRKRSIIHHDLNSSLSEDDDTLTTITSSEYSIPYTTSSSTR